jgi:glycosyltransferase involved in cell wall biosynthesis
MSTKKLESPEKKVTIVIPHFERNTILSMSLRCINSLYADRDIEVIIVDDCSREGMRPSIPAEFKLKLKLVQIQEKKGINPCTPFNMGVDHAEGDLIVLTSPEIIHTQSIFELNPNILEIAEDEYLVIPVFAVTDKKLNRDILETKDYNQIQEITRNKLEEFGLNLGKNGYSYANDIGAWYAHPVIKDSKLNFLSIIFKESYLKIGGFDSRFRKGTGFDDMEFLRKLQDHGFKIQYPESLPALHLDHEEVSSTSQYRKKINSNEKIFHSRLARALKFSRKVEKHKVFRWDMGKNEFIEIACRCA